MFMKCWFVLNSEYRVNRTCSDWIVELYTGMSIIAQMTAAYSLSVRLMSADGSLTCSEDA